ncbi:Flp family type IVb pilin [Loktanella sp. DJP18]|uniref:Flp family type IVb pilin n=1 Tax=Loktanella sp. DJP18 TaxID=3409788 RepID=UPI003BB74289
MTKADKPMPVADLPTSRTKKSGKSRGAALLEYSLLVGLISLGSIVAVTSVGTDVKRIYCKAANGMSQITGGALMDGCLPKPGAPAPVPGLPLGLVVVDAPVVRVASFSDVTFPNGQTGDTLVVTSIDGGAPDPFWLDLELVSRDAYDPDRTISACYGTVSGTFICAAPGSTSAVEVPVGATDFGYLVSLNEDVRMPLGNDVTISVSSSATMPAQDWNVAVVREDPEPIFEASFAFQDTVFPPTSTGLSFGTFAPISGFFNQDTFLAIDWISGNSARRSACYRMTAGGAPVCEVLGSTTGRSSVLVPVGAAESGLQD